MMGCYILVIHVTEYRSLTDFHGETYGWKETLQHYLLLSILTEEYLLVAKLTSVCSNAIRY
jgi:hypothetical protein